VYRDFLHVAVTTNHLNPATTRRHGVFRFRRKGAF
jgi:hypothetical protein